MSGTFQLPNEYLNETLNAYVCNLATEHGACRSGGLHSEPCNALAPPCFTPCVMRKENRA